MQRVRLRGVSPWAGAVTIERMTAHTSAPSANPLFAALTGQAHEELLAIAQPVSFVKGAVLLRQGMPTRGAFFLRIGDVEAAVRLPGGESLVVARVGAGGVIGEMSLLEHGICSATVTASSSVDGLFIGREDFRVLVARRSAAALAVQHAVTLNLCAKLSALNAQILSHPTPEDAPFCAAPSGDPLALHPRLRTVTFDYRRFLPVLPFFQNWEAEDIDDIADQCSVLELKRGDALFFERTEALACFVTIRGAIAISAPVAEGGSDAAPTHQRRLAVLGPGQLIGHRSLIDATTHAARAWACEDCVLLELPRAQFLDLYRGSTPASLRLQGAVHAALLRSMAHTNVTLTRLVNLTNVAAANRALLEAALAEQVLYAS